MKKENCRSEHSESAKCTVCENGSKDAILYDETREIIMRERSEFAGRLYSLRSAKKLSARKLSFMLGQAPGYISNIENGHNLPSMAQFFEICESLEISPFEFFRYTQSGSESADLYLKISQLNQQDKHIITELISRLSEGAK